MNNSTLFLIATQAWQILALAVLVWILTRSIGATRARLSHALWLLVLLKCVTPPIFAHNFGLFSYAQTAINSPYDSHEVVPVDDADGNFDVVAFEEQHAELSADFSSAIAAASVGTEIPQQSALSLAPIVEVTDAAPTETKPDRHEAIPGQTIALISLAVGISLCTLMLLCRYLLCLYRIRRFRVTEFDHELAAEVKELCAQFGMRRIPRIIVSDVLFGPAVLGIWRHVIVLPRCLLDGDFKTASTLKPILAHELLHIRRGDLLIGSLQAFVQCVWWFHPAVWLTNRLLSRETERCCDEDVIAELGCSPAVYARSLLSVIESKSPLQAVPVFPGMKPVEITTQRMERIMSLKNGSRTRMPLVHWLTVGALGLLLLPGAALTQAYDESKPDGVAGESQESITTIDDASTQRSKRRKAAEDKIRETLEQKVSLHFTNAPFLDVIRHIATTFGLNIAIDTRAVHAVKPSLKNEKVTINIEKVSLRNALKLLLKQTGDLTFSIEYEVLKICPAPVSIDRTATTKPQQKTNAGETGLRQNEETQPTSAAQPVPGQIRVVGMVSSPGVFTLPTDQRTTVVDAIALAGGLSSGASGRVVLKRSVKSSLANIVESDAGVVGYVLSPSPDRNTVFLEVSLSASETNRADKLEVTDGDVISVAPSETYLARKEVGQATEQTVIGVEKSTATTVTQRNIRVAGDVPEAIVDEIRLTSSVLSGTRSLLTPQNVDADVSDITSLFRQHGYFDVKVQVEPRYSRDRNRVSLTFSVETGRQYRIRDIRLEGNEHIKTSDLTKTFRLKPGSAFSVAALSHDQKEVFRRYVAENYVSTDVIPNLVFTQSAHEVDVHMNIKEGQQFTSAVRTAPPVVRPPASTRQQKSISPSQRAAQQIAERLQQMQLEGYDIEIKVSEGNAEMKGFVKSDEQVRMAGKIAAAVPGIERVSNQLKTGDGRQIVFPVPMTVTPGYYPARKVEMVPFNEWPGVIRQVVRSAVDGLTSAENQEASADGPSDLRKKNVADAHRMAKLITSNLTKAGFEKEELKVAFSRGRVFLYGNVDSAAKKQLAEDVVAGVEGVRSVENRLVVPRKQQSEVATATGPMITVTPRIIIEEESELTLQQFEDSIAAALDSVEVKEKRTAKLAALLNQKLEIKVREQSLETVLKSLEQRTGIVMTVDDRYAEKNISCDIAETDVRSALKTLLSPLGLRAAVSMSDDLRSVSVAVQPKANEQRMVTRAYNVADLVVPEMPLSATESKDEGVINALAATKASPDSPTAPRNLRAASNVVKSNGTETLQADFAPLVELIRTSVDPDLWGTGREKPQIQPNENTLSLVVRQTAESHDKIVDLLSALRSEHELIIVSQCLVLQLPNDSSLTDHGINLHSPAAGPGWDLVHAGSAEKVTQRLLNAGAKVVTRPQITTLPQQPVSLKFNVSGTEESASDLELAIAAHPLPDGDLLRLEYSLNQRNAKSTTSTGKTLLKSGQTLVADYPAAPDADSSKGRLLILVTPKLIRHDEVTEAVRN